MPLYGDLEVRHRLGRGSALPSYAPEGVRLESTDEMDLRLLALEAAKAGALGGAIGGGSARGLGAANQTEIERLNREFMIDRARRRARQGLGGTTLEDLGGYASRALSEEGTAFMSPASRYLPYGGELPYGVQEKLGLGSERMRPVQFKGGGEGLISDTNLQSPLGRTLAERQVAGIMERGGPSSQNEVDLLNEALGQLEGGRSPRAWFLDEAPSRPLSDIDLAASGISREFAELAYPEVGEEIGFAESPAGAAYGDARAQRFALQDQADRLRSAADDELLRGGRYAPVFTPEQRGYPLEDLSPGRSGSVLHPADTASNWNILDDRGLPASFEQPDLFTEAGQEAYNRSLRGNVYFDQDSLGKMSAFALPGKPEWLTGGPLELAAEQQFRGPPSTGLYIEPEMWTPRVAELRDQAQKITIEADEARRLEGELSGYRPRPAPPTRMSRIGSALKSGIKGALSPVSILTDAAIGSAVGAGSALAGYESARPRSAGLFTPPGPGYEGVASPELIQRIAERKERENEMERRQLLEQYRATGYDLDPNTRLRDLR